jgi:hypothetical protein
MPTRDKELSSKGRAKAEGKDAPKAETPMARFRKSASGVMQVPYEKVRAAERREKKKP